MKLRVSAGEVRLEVELEGQTARVDGRDAGCDWVRVARRQFTLLRDNRVYDLAVELRGEECTVWSRGRPFRLKVTDARAGEEPSVEEAGIGVQRITAEMPGKVVRVLVRAGDAVRFGQGLLVLEAMKMQNEIAAPKAGTVREVGVSEGRAVSSGDFLISLES